MTDPDAALQALVQHVGLKPSLFAQNSRYYGIETTTLQTASGQTVNFLRRRFAPSADRLALRREHVVVQGDRLDNLAAKYFGDPELFWRLCDANIALRPDELIEIVGRRLRIAQPLGIPGVPSV
jgi:hypothetical protein